MQTDVYLALGSNLGEREQNLEIALHRLAASGLRIVQVSSIYETEPVGYRDQDWFLNMAARAETNLQPSQALQVIRQVETDLGRERKILNGPRTIDIDILFWGGEVIDTPELTVPHPRLHERRFVLLPLADIGGRFVHPVMKISVQELLKELKSSEQVRVFKEREQPQASDPEESRRSH